MVWQIRNVLVRNMAHVYSAILALLWVAGIVVGTCFAYRNSNVSSVIAVQFSRQKASLLLMLMMQGIPLLLMGLPTWRCWQICVGGMFFLRMFVFGLTAGSVYLAFSSAGWIVCILLLFSQIATMVPLVWLTIKKARGELRPCSFAFISVCVASVILVIFDCYWVSPFLTSLMKSL